MFPVLCFNKNPSFTAVPLLFHIITATADVFIILWLSLADSSATVFPSDNHLSVCGHQDFASAAETDDNLSATDFPGKIALRVGQNCRPYDTRAQNDTREDFIGTQHSLLSQLFLFLLPDQRRYVVKNMCVYTHI
jgi:hypothetical protein